MRKQKDWFKDRGYPHFTSKTPLRLRRRIENYISNPNKVSKHPFSPLILKEIKQRRYKFSNFGLIRKRSHKKIINGKVVSNKKIREILYATHIDAHIYSYYAQKIISPKYESYLQKYNELNESITAYRRIKTKDGLKYKNNIHFAKEVFDEIKRKGECAVLAFDIENFFPSLDHQKLKSIWAHILDQKSLPRDHYNLFKAVTKFSYVRLDDLKINKNYFDEKSLAKNRKKGTHTYFESIKNLVDSDILIHKNQKKNTENKLIGIPQGLPISALLANMYMLPFDKVVIENLTKPDNIFYRRYSDDIIVICEKNDIERITNFILKQIKKIKLSISREKTETTIFKKKNGLLQCYRLERKMLKENIPLNYLGFEFYGYRTLLKSKNLSAFYREMKYSVKRKHKRAEKVKEKHLLDNAPVFKTKINRLYSFKGVKTRRLPAKKISFQKGSIKIKKYERMYRGNYLRYAYRASEEMEAPEIKRQLRNHWKILQQTLKKYDFNNVVREKTD